MILSSLEDALLIIDESIKYQKGRFKGYSNMESSIPPTEFDAGILYGLNLIRGDITRRLSEDDLMQDKHLNILKYLDEELAQQYLKDLQVCQNITEAHAMIDSHYADLKRRLVE
jgi:hypothetical protein